VLSTRPNVCRGEDKLAWQFALNIEVPLLSQWVAQVIVDSVDGVERTVYRSSGLFTGAMALNRVERFAKPRGPLVPVVATMSPPKALGAVDAVLSRMFVNRPS
jgi:hypothetical protein